MKPNFNLINIFKIGKIILFCKGADTIIKERLTPKSVSTFTKEEDHLNKFAEDALRTLCLAWKEIPEDVYQQWAIEYHAASTTLVDRGAKISAVYEKIETDLLLVGSSAIEDKLQDGVPECIATLAKANIKIWVLTGDKQETAINIGYSCQLLTNDMDVYTIDSNSELEIIKEIREKRQLVEQNLQRVALEKENTKRFFSSQQHKEEVNFSRSYAHPSSNKMAPPGEYPMNDRSFTNLEKEPPQYMHGGFEPLSSGNALVINGQSLVHALSPSCELEFLELACLCKAVICCRVTPGQKKAVVDLVKTHKKAITLAVGDGANDVSMIKCK